MRMPIRSMIWVILLISPVPNCVQGADKIVPGKDDSPRELAPVPRDESLSLTIRGDVPPALAPTVGKLTTLFYECYPKLLKRFDNPKKPASRLITIIFKRKMPVPAYCQGSEISVSIDWLLDHPDDIGLLTHELTHAVQAYTGATPGWLVEGIADYARSLYGPKETGGWSLPSRLNEKNSYKDSYRVTAKFLVWLDMKHPKLVDQLHRSLQDRTFQLDDFKTHTGQTIDVLWEQFLQDLAKSR